MGKVWLHVMVVDNNYVKIACTCRNRMEICAGPPERAYVQVEQCFLIKLLILCSSTPSNCVNIQLCCNSSLSSEAAQVQMIAVSLWLLYGSVTAMNLIYFS